MEETNFTEPDDARPDGSDPDFDLTDPMNLAIAIQDLYAMILEVREDARKGDALLLGKIKKQGLVLATPAIPSAHKHSLKEVFPTEVEALELQRIMDKMRARGALKDNDPSNL